jgi:hypothetical protein
MGELEAAQTAYERAIAVDPEDPDPRLHLAHLLKRLGRRREAGLEFLNLMRLSPTLEVSHELMALGLGQHASAFLARAVRDGAATGYYLEVRDLLIYLAAHATVTGITRVGLSLTHYVLEHMGDDEAGSYHFVCQNDAVDSLFLVPRPIMRNIIALATSSMYDQTAMAALVEQARGEDWPIRLGAGAVYFIPGAFWMACDNSNFFSQLKQDGVRIGAYIYDLIPLTHAQYCEVTLTRNFNIALAEAADRFPEGHAVYPVGPDIAHIQRAALCAVRLHDRGTEEPRVPVQHLAEDDR